MKGDIKKMTAVSKKNKDKTSGIVPSRDDIDDSSKWVLEHIYPDTDSWEKDFAEVQKRLGEFQRFSNNLGQNSQTVLECFQLEEELGVKIEKLFVYAHMKSHENTSVKEYQGLADRSGSLLVRFSAETSFIVPELNELPPETLDSYMKDESLSTYRFFFEDIIRMKKHVLSPAEERIIALTGEMSHAPDTIFTLFTNADIRFPAVKDENGNKQELTEERYQKFIKSQDRKVRKKAFKTLFNTYLGYENSISAMYSSSIKSDMFNSRIRGYGSTLEASLERNNIPLKVYNNVIDTVRENIAPLHEYVQLRKKVLDTGKIHMYDLYVPLFEETRKDIPYEDAVEMVREGLKPLGKDYMDVFDHGIKNGWIDVYENQGKKNGAYSWGSYGTHPYVLLNYNGTIRDVFTLAHEMGHAIHSWYSHKNQPYIYGDYTIFLAEVASTTNESLLLSYLLEKSDSRKEKLFLLNYQLEQIRTTVYRQTLFAEFEKKVHSMAEKGIALTPDILKNVWHELNRDYYGSEIKIDKEIDIEWARIPHFYSSFYVYQYVTGFSAATSFAENILSGQADLRDKYLEFLGKGSSDYSTNILRDAGVDMTTERPLEITIEKFRTALEDIEKMIK